MSTPYLSARCDNKLSFHSVTHWTFIGVVLVTVMYRTVMNTDYGHIDTIHQGHQPPEPRPVPPRYHPEGEVNTGASKLGPRAWKNSLYLKAIRLLNSHH